MAEIAQVHWHEGLFLQPHHLQFLQRHVHDCFVLERKLTQGYSYGLMEAKISSDELENMRVSFDRLRLIMPGGLVISVPENTHLPALDIKEAFAAARGPFTVSIGVPLWYPNRANTIEPDGGADTRTKCIYQVAEVERLDENTGENPQTVLVRHINARLLLDGDDRSDMEVMPLLSIAPAVGEEIGLPRQDTSFIPPCLALSGSPVLRDTIRDLVNQVEASRKELVVQITRGGFSIDAMRGVQFEQMNRLKTLNRFSARLPHLLQAPNISPFQMYLELRELLAELAALQPDRDPFETASYDHDNPAPAFNELSTKIRSMLKGAVAARFIRIPFTRDDAQKIMLAALTDESLSLPNEYYIGIKSREDPRVLAQLVEDGNRFKLMPESLVTRRVFGVKLSEERHPPMELPSQVGLNYFRLNRDESARMWERITQEKTIAIRWPEMETSDFEITLFMTVP
jgi:type VI secretion system protein ImpJ